MADQIINLARTDWSFDLTGTSIVKTESLDTDVYCGPKEELLKVGVVLAEQWPPDGKQNISWLRGHRVVRNCRKDETYRNINLYQAIPKVTVGVPLGVTMARRKSLRRQWEKDQADNRQAELNECAQRAQRALKHMPSSKQEFIESEIASLRSTLFSICLKHLDAACEFHGYRFTTQSKEAVLMAVDVLVDELACGDVVFDAERHEQIIAKHRASIRCADLQFENHLQALTALNPTLLEGELQ